MNKNSTPHKSLILVESMAALGLCFFMKVLIWLNLKYLGTPPIIMGDTFHSDDTDVVPMKRPPTWLRSEDYNICISQQLALE